MKLGDVVWVRDTHHASYTKWSKAIYIRPIEDDPWFKVFVEYIVPETGKGMCICGRFPECKAELEPGDEKRDQEYA